MKCLTTLTYSQSEAHNSGILYLTLHSNAIKLEIQNTKIHDLHSIMFPNNEFI